MVVAFVNFSHQPRMPHKTSDNMIEIAYSFKQATKIRKPPSFKP